MTILLVDTAGAPDANTYCSLADATAYFANLRLHFPDWDALEGRESALVWSTRLLDQMCNWYGVKSTTEQALRWPRNSVFTQDGENLNGATIPQWLKNATAEFAVFLIAEDRTAEANRDIAGIKSLTVGPIELEYQGSFDRAKTVMPPSVWAIIKHYCIRYGRQKTLVRS